MWKNIDEKDIIEGKLYWLSYKNIPFIGHFYSAYGGLNYESDGSLDELPYGIKGYHMGSAKQLDGYCEIIEPPTFLSQTREEKLNKIL